MTKILSYGLPNINLIELLKIEAFKRSFYTEISQEFSEISRYPVKENITVFLDGDLKNP